MKRLSFLEWVRALRRKNFKVWEGMKRKGANIWTRQLCSQIGLNLISTLLASCLLWPDNCSFLHFCFLVSTSATRHKPQRKVSVQQLRFALFFSVRCSSETSAERSSSNINAILPCTSTERQWRRRRVVIDIALPCHRSQLQLIVRWQVD